MKERKMMKFTKKEQMKDIDINIQNIILKNDTFNLNPLITSW